MAACALSPATTLALVLGAHEWPECPGLESSETFANSASRFLAYLFHRSGMALLPENVNNLFDDPRAPAEILKDIGVFLQHRQRELQSQGQPASDLIFYFVGHGGFVDPGDSYCMFLQFTREQMLHATSLHITDVAELLREHARHLRRYLILDACFAGAASRFVFQSTPGDIIRRQVVHHLPQKGIALLCSSSSQHPSKAPKGEQLTMFSGALVEVLSREHPEEEHRLSLRAVGRLVTEVIRAKYEDTGVRPEVHSPDQRDGDVADLPLFPNPARGNPLAQDDSAPLAAADSGRDAATLTPDRSATAGAHGLPEGIRIRPSGSPQTPLFANSCNSSLRDNQGGRWKWVLLSLGLAVFLTSLLLRSMGIPVWLFRAPEEAGPQEIGLGDGSTGVGAVGQPGPTHLKPSPESAAPLRLKGWIDVRVWEGKKVAGPRNPHRRGLYLHQLDALPMKVNDEIQVEAELTQPMFVYVVWINSAGQALPVYPWRNFKWDQRPAEEQAVARLKLPEGAVDDGWEMDEGAPGMETLLLLARKSPITRDIEDRIKSVLSGLGHQPLQDGKTDAAVWFENGAVVTAEKGRAPKSFDAQRIDDPVLRTQGVLRDKLGAHFDYSRAVSFAFRGK